MSASPMTAEGRDEPGAALLAAADAAATLSRLRLAGAGAQLAASPAAAIDDELRARAGLMVAGVLGAVEAVLRAAEPLLDAAPSGTVAARFAAAGLLGRSAVGAVALVRAEDHRLAAALKRVVGDTEDDGVRRLDPIDGDLASERFAVRAAEMVRLDRAGDPLLPLHDIPAEDRHAIVWQVAACLADAALSLQGAARAGSEDAMHRAAAAAVSRCLAAVDDGDGVAPAAMRLAHGLGAADRLDDALVAGTLAAGRIASFAATLAVRSGIDFEEARMMVTAPPRCAVLLRACAVDRAIAVPMLIALALALDRGAGPDPLEAVAALADAFDQLPVERARAEVRRTRLEPVYRDALAALAAHA